MTTDWSFGFYVIIMYFLQAPRLDTIQLELVDITSCAENCISNCIARFQFRGMFTFPLPVIPCCYPKTRQKIILVIISDNYTGVS